MIHAHPRGALHQRLHDDCADLVRVPGQERVHRGEGAPAVRFPAFAVLAHVAIGRGRAEHVHQQGLVDLAVKLHVADRERAQRLAVITPAQGDEAALARAVAIAPEVEAHLERDLDRARAVVGVEAPGEAMRGDRGQPLGEHHRRLVREAGQKYVLEPSELRGERGVDTRVGVAEQVDPPRADRVQIAPPVVVVEPGARAACDRHHRQPLVVLHLGAGVPDDFEIAPHEVEL